MGNDREDLPLYPAVDQHHAIVQHQAPRFQASSAPPVDQQPTPQSHPMMLLGPDNTVTTCVFCKSSIKTSVTYTNNTLTHVAGALWCTICCCCCIPYCSDTAKNADHYCPGCKRYLGTYRR